MRRWASLEKKRYVLRPLLFLLVFLSFCSLPLAVSGKESAESAERPAFYEELATEFLQLVESLPEEVRSELPPEFTAGNLDQLADGNRAFLTPKVFFSFLFSVVGDGLPASLSLLFAILSILLLSALVRRITFALEGGMGRVVTLLSALSILVLLLGTQNGILGEAAEFFSCLSSLTAGMLPLSGVLYAVGGNVTAAAASGEGTLLFLALTELIASKLLFPVVAISSALSLLSVLLPGISFRPISAAVKKTVTLSLGFLMMLLSAFLSMKVSLASKADSVSARTVKYVASSMIPLIGGSVADSLRTVGASVEYLRVTVGVAGVLLLLALLLPFLVKLLLFRLSLILLASLADLLDLKEEGALLSEFREIFGYLVALAVMSSVIFLFAATLLVKTTAAIG